MQERAVKLCDDPKTRLELKQTLGEYRRPTPVPGADDVAHFQRLLDQSLALVEAKRTIPLAALLAETDLAPCGVALAEPSTESISGERLYERARESVLLLGAPVWNRETEDWEVSLATGFVIQEEGVFVTNFHVLDVPDAAGLTAMTFDGRVFPVKSVLAVNPLADIAVCRLDGASGLRPLPLVADAKPGASVRVLSHPQDAYYSLTEGIISRYFVLRENGKATTMFTTTADFAVGSSGGPVFDAFGNVVGMVAATDSVYSGPLEDGAEDSQNDSESSVDPGDLQMVLKMCVPSADILKLVSGPSAR
jgi:S1-C subfamily serine protease